MGIENLALHWRNAWSKIEIDKPFESLFKEAGID
jgi:hypothetical protein